ncbi:MAG: GlgC family sugar phosphate nucleotidyltransferase [Planctomycetota bacterium]|jgi:NDP-sugar pyrophosphorylase family protein
MGVVTAVILAGTLRPSPLRLAIDLPAPCLPIGADRSLLDAWRQSLAAVDAEYVRIVVNNAADVEAVGHAAGRGRRSLRIVAEPAAWRGTAGLLQDVTNDLEDDDLVIVVEAASLPPASLEPLVSAIGPGDAGAVGLCGRDGPSGVYAFRREALASRVPAVGYHDVKEQLLPALHRAEQPVRTAPLGTSSHRIRDRRSYLEALRIVLAGEEPERMSVAREASVSGSALLHGFCVLQPGAVVEDGAVVHESVIMNGATISGGAVVTRSIVGPMATIGPRERVVREIVVTGSAAPTPSVARPVVPAAS